MALGATDVSGERYTLLHHILRRGRKSGHVFHVPLVFLRRFLCEPLLLGYLQVADS